MPTYFSINRPTVPSEGINVKDSAGYQRKGEVCYLWRLPLDRRDTNIRRFYNKGLDETAFVVSGIPTGSRPQRLWVNGCEAFGAKLSFEQDGEVAVVCLKRNNPYNPKWEIEILSPVLTPPQ